MTYFVMALALVLGFTQCKKEQVNTPGNETKTVNITLNVGGNGGGSRHDINTTTGAVDFQDGDVIYVGNGSTYIGTLTRTDGVFSGPINEPADETEIYFFFVGGLTPSSTPEAGTTPSFTVDISDQSTKMPVLSCNHVTYHPGTTSYSCKLENQCALVKFTTASTTAPVHVGGLYTGAMIDFDNNSITNNGTTGFVALNSKSATEKWAVLLPQTGFEDAEAAIAHVGYTTTIPAIAADGFITGDAAISISTLSNIVYLDWLTGNYTATNGKILTGTLSGNYKISVENKVGGATVTLRNATIKYTNTTINTNWAGLSCLGDATIMLEGTNLVESGMYRVSNLNIADYPGIHIAASHTLTIDGSGELTASSCRQTNRSRGAGIGGGYNEACGDIIIKGGIIHALGGKYGAAGIGSAGNYNNNAACGNITIEGGEVEAIAYGEAAGIGCGVMNRCGNILIKNGTVIAHGGEGSAGIGAGYSANNSSGASNSQCGTITIEGGTVTATGGQFGAGIGSGTSRGDFSHSICGNISITGGTVTATGGDGGIDDYVFYGAAGIGTGSSILGGYNGYSDCGDITITSGVTSVTATKGGGDYPAQNSIGKNHSSGSGTCGTITIGGTEYPSGATPNQGDGLTFVYPVPAPPTAPAGAINGLFSVSATQQVWFSQGNLLNGGNFADNQYDYGGLLQWAASFTSNYSGDWRALTSEEWNYLLTDRANASNLWCLLLAT